MAEKRTVKLPNTHESSSHEDIDSSFLISCNIAHDFFYEFTCVEYFC